ncbi:tyrosine-protein phosphatase non-receptor type 6 [Colletotrichum kahawae]|uniref:Tyrosine-protein phosphatase non-receptor type 6 n=1 Tax=Colletotrichum kahawae TaxID=34407 RepID=A0AAD9Y4G1_COLKA|nr:tyrosine-protein phosphatase non-receptor type 6 [Colletotrichum kahawae]
MVDDSNETDRSPAPGRSDEPQAESRWTLGSLWNTTWDLGSLTAKVSEGDEVLQTLEHSSSKVPHAEYHTRTLHDSDSEASRDDFSINWNLSPEDYPKEPSSGLPKASTLPDLGKLRYHRHLADFGQQLQKAAEATLVIDRKSNYVKVTVLLLHWEDEDSGMVFKVNKLSHMLSQNYGFIVERWAIPVTNRCHMEVSRKVGELVEDDNPVHLRVMFYTGSSQLTPKGQLVWVPRRDVSRQSRPPVVRWSAIQTLLEEAPVDILILLDCRKSHFPSFEGGNGVTSLIAACSFNTAARQESDFSFIEVLIRQLDSLRNLPSFSTSFLYSRIYQDIQSRPDQKESSSSELPVHLILSQDPAYPRDILLSATQDESRLRRSQEQGRSKEFEKCPSRCNSPSRKGPWHVNAERSNKSPNSPSLELSDHPRLLLSFRLYEDMDPEALRVDLFSHWLMSLPIPFNAVKVEAGRLAGNPVDTSEPEHPVSRTIAEGYLRQDEALNGCEFSPDGNILACWSKNTLTLVDFSLPAGSREFMRQSLPAASPLKAVVFTESLLIAATDETPLTCYVCNLAIRHFAVSPGQQFLSFLLGKTQLEEILFSQGVNLFQISVKKFVKYDMSIRV